MKFLPFKEAINKQFAFMAQHHQLFRADVGKDDMWQMYLSSFPEGTNPIFRERTEHDCNCCRSFIKATGNVIAIIDGERVSIWDITSTADLEEGYRVVAAAMSEFVKIAPIRNIFLHDQKNLGTGKNNEMSEAGDLVNTWNHFHYQLEDCLVNKDAGPKYSEVKSSVDVFRRGLDETTDEALDIVLDLIDQNSLYRGLEHRTAVAGFKKELLAYHDTSNPKDYVWVRGVAIGGLARFRNTVIGTLVTDISDGVPLDRAVASFEQKVAPQNYKRTSSVVTKGMIDQAKKKVDELGIRESLNRRFANKDDITVNNILFINRPTEAIKQDDLFDEMTKEVKVKSKFDKVEEVSIDKFVKDILPKATAVEVMLENNNANNLVSLVAPTNPEAKNIFKWANNFSWSYEGEVTDSIKERVKKAGGKIDAVLRCSLAWYNFDDLDIHVKEPDGYHISYGNKRNPNTTGQLDVDMNVGSNGSRDAVENIVWTNKSKMGEGPYHLFVNNYTKREDKDVGFEIEMEFEGVVYNFTYDKAVRQGQNVTVAKFNFTRKEGIKFIESLPSTQTSKEVWGLNTQQFHKVSMVMNSPNHWDGNETGNKHWFFMLEGAKNPNGVRGFYNEFLSNDLTPHRKVFEIMGAKTRAEPTPDQLSGLGFSSTQRNKMVCKVSGSFSRMVNVVF